MLKSPDAKTQDAHTDARQHSARLRRRLRRTRGLWYDPEQKTPAIGCGSCPDRPVCGGLQTETRFFDCLQLCCNQPADCDRVCLDHPDFVQRVREVEGFMLDNVPRGDELPPPTLPPLVPILFAPPQVSVPLDLDAVCLPFHRLIDRRRCKARYQDIEHLTESFRLHSNTTIIATGTDRDRPHERWWGMGVARRLDVIRALKDSGVAMVTTPNFSVFIDRPRWDDLHAMKRIALVHEEFLRQGMPAALHVNGRTEADFERWSAYIAARPEITHIAYEFTTGTGHARRSALHAAWLEQLARAVGRPLHLLVRGGTNVLPQLHQAYSGITWLDTTLYMKTVHRRRGTRSGATPIVWKAAPTRKGELLDGLWRDNWATLQAISKELITPKG